MIPMFPELRAALEQAWELAPEGAVCVINEQYRKAVNRKTVRPAAMAEAVRRPAFWPRNGACPATPVARPQGDQQQLPDHSRNQRPGLSGRGN
jgi:hypothetical protein